ncbi:helix-turn-helix transcriptional regulator [Novilysobacter arseniciresistens]|uniref:helix-turn-helix transcriptional regulator n=1 Tax=Novilysobacter arseniciresistens TaxID=1385522 RepID=UPI0009DD6D87|nr:AlpA family phage regulatory protein [Lysobacter arseniciresistens]
MAPPLPHDSLLRVRDITRDPKTGTPGLLGISRSTFLQGVKDGRYPRPLKLGGSTCWRASDIQRLIAGNDGSATAAGGAR